MTTPSRPGGATGRAPAAIAGIAAPETNFTPEATSLHRSVVATGEGGRRWRVIAPILILAVALLAGAVACRERPIAPIGTVTGTPLVPSGATIRVHVTGAVQSPGVYELRVGDRVQEALHAAGGVTVEADDAAINLAQRVRDEQRLEIPARSPVREPTGTDAPDASNVNAPVRAVLAPTKAPAQGTPTKSVADAELEALLSPSANPEGGARIDVNRATVAQLERLPGIGAVSARRVATWRADNGPIRTVADLRAAGLTPAVLRKALPYLALS